MRDHKYHARPTTVDGIRFASQKEARRYQELRLLERAGEITQLELQPRYRLDAAGGEFIGEYRADFRYLSVGVEVVEDVKGVRTSLYRWKKRHVEAQYGIAITET